MLSRRLLFRYAYTTTNKLSASCKCTISGNPPNVIKNLNAENKNLFGSLLESKTQRRKNLSKASTVNPDSKTPATTDVDALVQNKAPKKKTRSKKARDIETVTVLSDNSLSSSSTITSGSCVDDVNNHVSSSSVSYKLNSQPSTKSKTEKSSLNKSDLVSTQDSQNTESIVLSKKLILKSAAMPVNENSYALDNPDKQELSTNSCCSLENIINYGFTDPLVKDYMKFPSVSKIMEDTMSPTSRMVLSKWRKNMVADLGEEGFAKHCTALKERGHDFHGAVRNAVLGNNSSDGCHSDVTRNALRSLEWVLSLVTNPLAVESLIAHPLLQYKGIPDCVAMFRGVPVVIDWKLSDKPKKSLKDTYDAPVQITAYMGALNHDPNYKWKVSHGLVAVAYTSGDPCDVFLLAPKHCEIYWRHWLLRFHKYNTQSHLHVDHQIDEKSLQSV